MIINQLNKKIKEAKKINNWDEVIKIILALKKIKSKTAQDHLHLTEAYMNKSQYSDAKKECIQLNERFPSMTEGLEKLIEISNIEKDWDMTIEYSTCLVEKFPEKWSGYWYLGVAYKKTNKIDKAIETFELLSNRFPKNTKGLQEIIEIKNFLKDWKGSAITSERFINNFPNRWQGYWWKGQALMKLGKRNDAKTEFNNLIEYFPELPYGWEGLYQLSLKTSSVEVSLKEYYFRKIETLNSNEGALFNSYKKILDYGLTSEANDIIDKIFQININSPYAYWANAILKARSGDIESSYCNYKNALKFSKNQKQYRDIILSSKPIFQRMKRTDEYFNLINEILSIFPDDDVILNCWAKIVQMNKPLSISLRETIERYEELLLKNPQNIYITNNYIKTLLSANETYKAEELINIYLKKNPSNRELFKSYCLASAYRKDFETFEKRYNNFLEQFSYDYNLFFHHLNSLVHLGRTNEILYDYDKFNLSRFGGKLNQKDLNRFQIDILLNNSTSQPHKPIIDEKTALSGSSFCESFDELDHITFQKVVHSLENEVLIICFEGLSSPVQTQYLYNRIRSVDVLESLSDLAKNNHDFKGFARNTPQFNFLLIKDLSSSSFQKNFEANLEKIRQAVSSIKHKYLVTIGVSAGGLASILFGEHLSANSVYSFQPRLQALFYACSNYHRELQMRYQLYNSETLDMAFLQRKQGGFSCKTYISICENEPSDFFGVSMLNKLDSNLNITLFSGDTHNNLQYMGVKNAYSEVTKNIEFDLSNNFDLPINGNIFSHIKGFISNSKGL